jgi:hypothetical protein
MEGYPQKNSLNWRHGTSGRELTYQAQDPEFKYQHCQKKRKEVEKPKLETLF